MPKAMLYEAVIGLEVHVQLKTKGKLFAPSPYRWNAPPNSLIDPQVLGLPGATPMLNIYAVKQAVLLGLLLNCKTQTLSAFDRKNYFYPDNPKNYQITQHYRPLHLGGQLEVVLGELGSKEAPPRKHIALHHIHLEEDVAKLTHRFDQTLIDYNRAGVPLAEIVTQPELKSPQEAAFFLKSLKILIASAGLSDCDMEKGQLRCDANISVRPQGTTTLNPKVEIKNLNSISNVRDTLAYEIKRQTQLYKTGKTVLQETRRWDARALHTRTLREKENAEDYRYFPDPDLPILKLSESDLSTLKTQVPETPLQRQSRYQTHYQLPHATASVLCANPKLYRYFEAALPHPHCPHLPIPLAKWIVNRLGAESSFENSKPTHPVDPAYLTELIQLLVDKKLHDREAKTIWKTLLTTPQSPRKLAEKKGLLSTKTTTYELTILLRDLLEDPAHQTTLQKIKDGKTKALNALIGPAMTLLKGKGNPQQIRQTLQKAIDTLPPR